MNFRLGIFDSGIGGVTVLKRVAERHGDIPCLYLGDSARLPYGERSSSEIRAIAEEVVHWLSEQKVSNVLVACNTTNSLALDVVHRVAGVPVHGLIEAAAEMITENRVGVLSTPATASSFAYSHRIETYKPGTLVLEQGCPELVPFIEAGDLDSNKLRKVLKKYLLPFLAAKVEAVVLGCSHYPLLEPVFRELLPEDVRLLDPAVGLARKLDSILGPPTHSLRSSISLSNTRICVTAQPSRFASRARDWLGNCPEVELVSLRSKACFF